MKKYIEVDRIKDEAPFIKLAITTKKVNAKDVSSLKEAFTENEFNLDNLVSNIQIHSDIVNKIDESNLEDKEDGDALITNLKNIPIMVFTADCVPVAIVDKKKKVISVAHAGWKGTYAEIAKKTVQSMISEYSSNIEDLICVIGPSIGSCCYEVSQDLYEKFEERFGYSDRLFELKNEKYYLNLWGINEYSLNSVGISSDNIIKLNICTNCNCDKFHSYRAHNKTDKRIGLIIEIKE